MDSHGPNYEQPPLDLIEDKEEYEVDQILDSRRHGRGSALQYLVQWKGYPDSDNQWVTKQDLFAPQLIKDFHQQHPQAPAPFKV